MMTIEKLKLIYPQSTMQKRVVFFDLFNEYLPKYGISNKARMCAYFAQIGHESGQLNYVEEIASGKAYDTGRLARILGNTPEEDGDGQRYKGRGLIQVTGTSNYRAASVYFKTDFLKYPELLKEPRWAVRTSLWFWETRDLNQIADSGTLDSFKQITKIINGSYNGLDERIEIWERCKRYL